jgi:hypothetical protein
VRLVLSLACTALIACIAIASASSGWASERTGPRTSLTLMPTLVRAGGTVRIRGTAGSCPSGDTVFVLSRAFVAVHSFAGVPAVLARVRRGGSFRAATVIPAARKPGRYGVTARCGGGNLGLLRILTIRR